MRTPVKSVVNQCVTLVKLSLLAREAACMQTSGIESSFLPCQVLERRVWLKQPEPAAEPDQKAPTLQKQGSAPRVSLSVNAPAAYT